MSACELLRPMWGAPPRVRAAFTLRGGGVSAGPYESLNLGTHVGDDPAAVCTNRDRVRASLELPAEPAWLEQVHGTDVVDLDSGHPVQRLRGDAAVSRTPGRVAVIQVADCMPVLFAARDGGAIGAAHAGWRGLASGVLEATIRAMRVAPSQLVAWLGPAIGPRHFEVGDEVRAAFIAHAGEATLAFAPSPAGRWLCDLEMVARQRLRALGVMDVSGGGWCTYADDSRFFSYRRQGACGRMGAFIWMAAD